MNQSRSVDSGLGATPASSGRWSFRIWAPRFEKLAVHVLAPRDQIVRLERQDNGYHCGVHEGLTQGARYLYRLPDGRELPDPASRSQPDGVHGPSELVDLSAFVWDDDEWAGPALSNYIIYELHIGTYTGNGTFDAGIPHIGELRELGVTAVEIMPVAQFPGSRNWGYDGAYPFAVQNSYGGSAGLQRFVNAAHRAGIAVVLDVVYNHLGPEGNYLGEYAPYFTDRYKTPWGAALNFDGPSSDEVRRYFIENALYWFAAFHVDALRLDAIHGIVDTAAVPFLADLSAAVESLAARTGRKLYLIAESDLNDIRVLRSREHGGYGLDAQWSDDFHHAAHALLTGERAGYYQDFGSVGQLAATLREGWCYSGQYSTFRRRRHGNSPREAPRHKFVVCSQNHDQVANRAVGDRLSQILDLEALKTAAGITLLSPFVPLLFMGEEYGETAPFQYFTSHSDPDLVEAVRRGRREEFTAFGWAEDVPDPHAESTFLASKLHHDLSRRQPHRTLRAFYRELIEFRRRHLPIELLGVEVLGFDPEKALAVRYSTELREILMFFNFGTRPASIKALGKAGIWHKRLDSADPGWCGPGTTLAEKLESDGTISVDLGARHFAVFMRENARPDINA